MDYLPPEMTLTVLDYLSVRELLNFVSTTKSNLNVVDKKYCIDKLLRESKSVIATTNVKKQRVVISTMVVCSSSYLTVVDMNGHPFKIHCARRINTQTTPNDINRRIASALGCTIKVYNCITKVYN